MRHTVLGFACLTLVCVAHESGWTREPAGRGFAAEAARASGAGAGPAPAGLCEEADCAVDARFGPRLRWSSASWLTPPPSIAAAIAAASAASGVDLHYLLRTAALESSFDPMLLARTSTATGLYQFVEQTWLYMMREFGAGLGWPEFAAAIAADANGYSVADARLRAEILELRYNPWLSAAFAAAFTRRNAVALARALGREPDSGELYLAHVLGASGGAQLIRLAEQNPGANACEQFARAARANRSIFYDGDRPRTAEEVYAVLTNKYFDIPVPVEEQMPWVSAPAPAWRELPLPVELPVDPVPLHARR